MKNDFIIPTIGIKNRITTIQKYLQNSVIDALCILQSVDLSYFSGTAQNGLLCTPEGNNPLHFINKYLPGAEKESSLLSKTGFLQELRIAMLFLKQDVA